MGQILQLFDEIQAPRPATKDIPRNRAEIIVGELKGRLVLRWIFETTSEISWQFFVKSGEYSQTTEHFG